MTNFLYNPEMNCSYSFYPEWMEEVFRRGRKLACRDTVDVANDKTSHVGVFLIAYRNGLLRCNSDDCPSSTNLPQEGSRKHTFLYRKVQNNGRQGLSRYVQPHRKKGKAEREVESPIPLSRLSTVRHFSLTLTSCDALRIIGETVIKEYRLMQRGWLFSDYSRNRPWH